MNFCGEIQNVLPGLGEPIDTVYATKEVNIVLNQAADFILKKKRRKYENLQEPHPMIPFSWDPLDPNEPEVQACDTII